MFHTLHMSRHPTMLWEPSEVWTAEEQSENFKPQTFMCCFKLETGGLFIGWLGLILNSFILAGIVFSLTLVAVVGCNDLSHCDRGTIIFLTIMLLPFVTSFMAMSYCCIKGTKQRDHEQVKSMLAYLGFAAMVSFACVFSFIIPAVIVGSILGLIFAYFFTVIYSLHDIFKLEQKRDCNRTLKRQSSF